MCKGYRLLQRMRDTKTAYFTGLMTNVHLPKKSQLRVSEIVKPLISQTKVERAHEEELFEKEWVAQGGELEHGR